jgi:hypothetical protein
MGVVVGDIENGVVMDRSTRLRRLAAALGFALIPLVGCESPEGSFPAPTADEVAAYYDYAGDLSVEMSGNVAQVTAVIDRDEYRMGGDVWAKASPYIFLFSPATRDAFAGLPGLGGVRVIVRYPDGGMLAQALLEAGTLNSIGWERALSIAGWARSEGTERPGYMRDLIRWGEENTDFEYNPEYITSVP